MHMAMIYKSDEATVQLRIMLGYMIHESVVSQAGGGQAGVTERGRRRLSIFAEPLGPRSDLRAEAEVRRGARRSTGVVESELSDRVKTEMSPGP